MWLPWYYGLALTLGCALGAWGLRGRADGPTQLRLLQLHAVLKETAVLAGLYTAWRWVGWISAIRPDRAFARAEHLWDLERALGIPNEQAWQAAIIDHGWIVQAANVYYGGAHVPFMGVFLVWMFFCHGDRYPPWRNALAVSTISCVLVQLYALAPPRLMPEFGLIDTPHLYGQSVYPLNAINLSGQLQAMPSIHVGWAALVAWATWSTGNRLARSLGLGHFVLTMWVVVVTGNHYWLDGALAVALLALSLPLVRAVERRLRAFGARDRTGADSVAAGAPVAEAQLITANAPAHAPREGR